MLPDPVADQVHDRLELELAGERRADLVDQGQLRVALAGLLDGPDAAEGGADVLPDEREEVAVGVGVSLVGDIGLADDDPDRLGLGLQRSAEPLTLADDADGLDLALGNEVVVASHRDDLGPAGTQDVGRQSASIPNAEWLPKGGIRNVKVDGVDVVGKVDRLATMVVEGDIEVLGVHQRRDRRVDVAIERLEVVRGGRRLGDPVEGRLDALRTLVLRLARLELGDARQQRGGVVSGGGLLVDRPDRLRGHPAPSGAPK